MKILVLSHLVPFPLHSGARVRLYYTLRHLGLRHDLHLLTFSRPSDLPASIERLRADCGTVETVSINRSRVSDLGQFLLSLLSGRSFLLARNLQKPMFRAVQEAVREKGPFDAVHADQIWMAPYAIQAKRLQGGNCLTVLDRHNALFRILGSFRSRARNPFRKGWLAVEENRLRRQEWRLVRRFDRVAWVSEEDLGSFREQGPSARSNGPAHQVIPISIEPREPLCLEGGGHRVTFVGGLNWPPNREGVEWFASQVWPAIRPRHAEAVFSVIGDRPDRLARFVGRTPGVEVLGFQPRLDRILAETAVFVVPLRSGSGTRVKILDAWSYGLPVVSTNLGAEGLKAIPGRNILIADSPTEFAEALLHALEDPGRSQALGLHGRETVAAHYDWRRNYAAWDRFYDENSVPDGLSAGSDPSPPVRVAPGPE